MPAPASPSMEGEGHWVSPGPGGALSGCPESGPLTQAGRPVLTRPRALQTSKSQEEIFLLGLRTEVT